MSIEFYFKVVTVSIAVGGFLFGLGQYYASQKWKRLEFAAQVLSKINSDPDLRLAITFLDWRERDVSLPERYLWLDGEKKTFRHSHMAMAEAFDMGNREILTDTNILDFKADKLNYKNTLYVDIFDRLFEYLEQVNAFVEMGLITNEDVKLLKYWVDRIYNFKMLERPVFQDYLKKYEFHGISKLQKTLSV